MANLTYSHFVDANFESWRLRRVRGRGADTCVRQYLAETFEAKVNPNPLTLESVIYCRFESPEHIPDGVCSEIWFKSLPGRCLGQLLHVFVSAKNSRFQTVHTSPT